MRQPGRPPGCFVTAQYSASPREPFGAAATLLSTRAAFTRARQSTLALEAAAPHGMFSSLTDALGLGSDAPTAPPSAPAQPARADFLKGLKDRLTLQIAGSGQRLRGPILAISETTDSFLMDSIAAQNKRFAAIWPADVEFDEQDAVDAFIALVTKARELDPRLQKRFDQVVPKKASEAKFWWRYFGHVHALLVRVAPTPEEMLADLMEKLPPARPLAERKFAPAAGALISSGDLPRAKVLEWLENAATVLSDDDLLNELGDEAVAAARAEQAAEAAAEAAEGAEAGAEASAEASAAAAPSADDLRRIAGRLCLSYQMELLEHKGIERLYGCAQMHPPQLMRRFGKAGGEAGEVDEEVQQALQQFIGVCQQAPAAAVAKLAQKPAEDVAMRKFKPAEKLESGEGIATARLTAVVKALRTMIEDKATAEAALEAAKASVAADERNASSPELAQKSCMDLVRAAMMASDGF